MSATGLRHRNVCFRSLALVIALFSLTTSAHGQCERQKLLAPDGEPVDMFGFSVASSAGMLVVGAFLDDANGIYDVGSATVYQLVGSNWSPQTVLLASDGATGDWFGSAVAIEGDVIVVGAYSDNDAGESSGSVYVYRPAGAGVWVETKLTASDADVNDGFGFSVAMSGDVLVAGAPSDEDNGYQSGSAYVLRHDGKNWIEEAKLLASDGIEWGKFGRAVAVDGDVIVVGAYGQEDFGELSGAAYVFRYNPITKSWTEETKLLASDGQPFDWFGRAVAIEGDTVIVGAPRIFAYKGKAFVYHFDGSAWVEQARLSAGHTEFEDQFGDAVSLKNGVAIVGARDDDIMGEESGSASVFRFDPAAQRWLKEGTLTASDGAPGHQFGISVTAADETAIVGAWLDDDNGIYSGSVYVFDLSSGPSDLNCDGAVDVMDLLILLSSWGTCVGASPCSQADLNGDGVVNVLDLLALLADWG